MMVAGRSLVALTLAIWRLALIGLQQNGLLCISTGLDLDGPASLQKGMELFAQQQYDDAAVALWRAVLLHEETEAEKEYDVQAVFQQFMQCYIVQDRMADGLAFVASESFQRGQKEMGTNYVHQALSVDPNNELALALQAQFMVDTSHDENDISSAVDEESNKDIAGLTPERLYEFGSVQFTEKNYGECADLFEIACIRSNNQLGPACANAVYCRTMIADYGFNGTQFDSDMKRIEDLTRKEVALYRVENYQDQPFAWRRTTSVHPHMMLGFPVDPKLKTFAAEAAAYMDEAMARAGFATDDTLPPLPDGLPYNLDDYLKRIRTEVEEDDFRIKVGFVGAGFNSKAVLFLSHDMFRFFNKQEFEIHVFSFGPPDPEQFIQYAMKGADWRDRVRKNADKFHDCRDMKKDHIKAAQFIHSQGIHILIEWDGFARQGERAQGLFGLRPAPVQILHQEYLGTSGALHTDYLFSDQVTSPIYTQHLYTEKLIYLPNHFFSKGHALQAEVHQPSYEYKKRSVHGRYELGTGTPRENRCLSAMRESQSDVSFVFCNFNKLLKANPETIRSWIRILTRVPNSMLCLLENPKMAIPYVRRFIYEAAISENADGDEINDRINFLEWERSPFDHQRRNQDFCNLMLDSHPYNGHTVAQDALYGGVPIVTRSDGIDMSSRVTTSANTVLGLADNLNAQSPAQYEDFAIAMALDATLYNHTRTHLIDTALQRNPMHPYWDVARYVKNFEAGLRQAFDTFIRGKKPEHVFVQESDMARVGTFDSEIHAHPPGGKTDKL